MFSQNDPETSQGAVWSIRSLLDSFDLDHMKSEVEQEGHARVALVGLQGAGKSSLLNSLRGWEVSPPGQPTDGSGVSIEDLGLFLVVDLPSAGPQAVDAWSAPAGIGYGEPLWSELSQVDLIVFLFNGALHTPLASQSSPGELSATQPQESTRLHLAEYQWYCRLRARGRPLVALLNKADLLGDSTCLVQKELARRLTVPVIPVCACDPDKVTTELLPRLLETDPKLLVALGRELPVIRRRVAARLINQTMVFSALAGLQPVPLLDLPLQLGMQMRLLLRLNALFGRPQQNDSGRELIIALAGGMALRLAIQQLAKLLPVWGWAISGLLSGLSAWLLGWGAVGVLEGAWKQPVARLSHLPALPAIGLPVGARRMLVAAEYPLPGESAEPSVASAHRARTLWFRLTEWLRRMWTRLMPARRHALRQEVH